MDAQRSGDPLTDWDFDRELAVALDVAPSAAFLARVRMRIAAEPEPSTWRPSWVFAAAGACVIAVVAAVAVAQLSQTALPPDPDRVPRPPKASADLALVVPTVVPSALPIAASTPPRSRSAPSVPRNSFSRAKKGAAQRDPVDEGRALTTNEKPMPEIPAITRANADADTFSLAVRTPQRQRGDGPRYTNGTGLVRPTDYREWIFLSSGLGMSDDPRKGSRPAPPSFTNVFVNPSSYRSFLQTGKWPDKTILVVEVRASDGEASINKAGRFQAGRVALEAHVKDSQFPEGWAFYDLSGDEEVVQPLSGQNVAGCVECHNKNTAVERTFVQYYPTLFEVARQKGTLKPGF